jgi:glucokinase
VTERVAVGVDIGGTKTAFALINEQGAILATHRVPTPVPEGADAVFQAVAGGIQDLLAQTSHKVVGVGIGSPGHLNPHTGIVYNATNLYWHNIHLLDGIRQYLKADVPLWLLKDANAAALGELYFGAAQGIQDMVLITIGTGLGGAAVVAGKIVDGADHSGMEIGHMPLGGRGRLCVCGMYGCPEMYVSGVGMLAGAHEYLAQYPQSILASGAEITTEAILGAYRQHDTLAVRLLDEATEWLCSVMIACIGIVNPAVFVIGGGLGHAAFDTYARDVQKKLHTRTAATIHRNIPIVQSTVQNSAVGPACIVWHQLKEQ